MRKPTWPAPACSSLLPSPTPSFIMSLCHCWSLPLSSPLSLLPSSLSSPFNESLLQVFYHLCNSIVSCLKKKALIVPATGLWGLTHFTIRKLLVQQLGQATRPSKVVSWVMTEQKQRVGRKQRAGRHWKRGEVMEESEMDTHSTVYSPQHRQQADVSSSHPSLSILALTCMGQVVCLTFHWQFFSALICCLSKLGFTCSSEGGFAGTDMKVSFRSFLKISTELMLMCLLCFCSVNHLCCIIYLCAA